MTLLDEPEVVALSIGPNIRHVRTPEGSKFFGLPIGSPITAALAAAVKVERAAQGITEPTNALSATPLSAQEISDYKGKGFQVSDLGINKPLDPKVVTEATLAVMAPGAGLHVVYKDGTHRVLTKNEDQTWAAQGFPQSITGTALAYAMGAADNVVQTGEGDSSLTPAPPAKTSKDYKPGDPIESPDHLNALEDGSHVQHKITKAVYKKQGDTLLSTKGGYNKKTASLSKVFAQKNLQFHSGPEQAADAVDTTDPNGPAHQPGTVLTHDQVGGLQAGHQTKYEGTGEVYTANGDGTHTHDATGSVIDHEAFAGATASGQMTYVGKKQNVAGDAAGAAGGDGHQPGDPGAGGQGSVHEGVGPEAGGDVGSGNPDGNGDGHVLTLLTGETAVIKGPLEHSEDIKAWAAQGNVTPQLYELDATQSAGAFRNAMIEFKKHNKYAAAVDVHDEADLQHMRLFLNKDGSAGIAIDGNMAVSLFITPDSPDKGGAVSMVKQQAELGATQLDAFDTVLPGLYAKAGFVPVARLKFNNEYAPEGWDKTTFGKYNHGEPDVVFMAYDPEHAHEYAPGEGVYVDDYDQGIAAAKDYAEHPGVIKAPKAHPLEQDTALKKGETVTSVDQFTAAAIGTKVQVKSNGSSQVYFYTKVADDQWLADGATTTKYPDNTFDVLLKQPKKFTITVAADEATNEADAKAAEAKKAEAAAKKAADSAPPTAPDQPLTDAQVKAAMVKTEHPMPKVKNGQKVITYPDGSHEAINGQWTHIVATYSYYNDTDGAKWYIAHKAKSAESAHKWLDGNDSLKTYYKSLNRPLVLVEPEDVPEEPLPQVNEVPEEQKQGEKVTDVDQLMKAPVGAKFDIYKPAIGTDEPKVTHYTKTDAYTLSDDAHPQYGTGVGLFASDVYMGNVHMVSAGGPNNLFHGEAAAAPAQPTQPDMESPTVSLFPGGKLFSKNDIAAALKSQQEASAFQVKYGFKTAKDNPLNTPDNIHALTQYAQAAYPGTAAKPAVVAFLKSKLGIADAPATSADDGAMIHIGAANPKSTGVQGLNGGDFTKAQIEDAIKILKEHQGKVFKSELGKKGSPLSALNPVSMIDAEKDKEANKQKFIALLQKALDDHAASTPSSAPEVGGTVGTSEEVQALPTDTIIEVGQNKVPYVHQADGAWANTVTHDSFSSDEVSSLSPIKIVGLPSAEKSSAPKVGAVLVSDDLVSLKPGDKFKHATAPTASTWTVNADGKTAATADGIPSDLSTFANGAKWKYLGGSASAEASTPKVGDALTFEQAKALKPGDFFKPKTADDAAFHYVVQADGTLKTPTGSVSTLEENKSFLDAGNAVYGGNKNSAPTIAETLNKASAEYDFNAPKVGDALVTSTFKDLPVGAVVKQTFLSDSGGDYTPTFFDHAGPDLWINQMDSGDTWSDTDFAKLVKHHDSLITIAKLPSAPAVATTPQVGDVITGDEAKIAALPLGSKVQVGANTFTVAAQGGALMGPAGVMSTPKSLASGGATTTVLSLGGGTPDAAAKTPGGFPIPPVYDSPPAALKAQYSLTIDSVGDLDALKPGDAVYFFNDVSKAVPYVKDADNTWVNGNFPKDAGIKSADFQHIIDGGALHVTPQTLKASFVADGSMEQKPMKNGDAVHGSDVLAAPVGAKFKYGTSVYKKISDTEVAGVVGNHPHKIDVLAKSADIHFASPQNVTWVEDDTTPIYTPQPTSTISALKPDTALGVPSVTVMAGMPSGTVVWLDNKYGDKFAYLKDENGEWHNAQTGDLLDTASLAGIDTSTFLYAEPSDLAAAGMPDTSGEPPVLTPIGASLVEKLAPGQTIALNLGAADPTNNAGWIVKQPDGTWKSLGTGFTVNMSMLQDVVHKNGGNGWVHVMLPGAQKFGYVAPMDMQNPTDGQKVWLKEGGTTSSYTFNDSVYIWENDDFGPALSTKHLLQSTKDGKVTWDNPDGDAATASGAITGEYLDEIADAGGLDGTVVYVDTPYAGNVQYAWSAEESLWKPSPGVTAAAYSSIGMKEKADNGKVSLNPPATDAPKKLSTTLGMPDGAVLWLDNSDINRGFDKYTYDKSADEWSPEDSENLSPLYGGYMDEQAHKGSAYDGNPSASASTTAAAATGKVKAADLNSPTDGMVVYSQEDSASPTLTKFVHAGTNGGWYSDDANAVVSHSNDYMQSSASGGTVFWNDPNAPAPAAPTLKSSDLAQIVTEAKIGSKVKALGADGTQHTYTYTKQEKFNTWEDDDGVSPKKSALGMALATGSGKVTVVSIAPATKKDPGKTGAVSAQDVKDAYDNDVNGTTVFITNDDASVDQYVYDNTTVGWKNLSGGPSHSGMWMIHAAQKGKVSWNDPFGDNSTALGDLPPKKDFKAGDAVHGQDLQFLKAGDLLKPYPDADTVLAKQNNGLFLNPETGTVYAPPFVSDMVGDHGFYQGHDDNKIFDQPYTGPGYAQTPLSHDSASMSQGQADAFTGDNAVDAPVGTVLIGTDGSFWRKSSDTAWQQFKDGKHINTASMNPGGYFYKAVDAHEIQPYVAAGPVTSKYGYLPGKYSSGGAAYMVIASDGSGVYVNAKGAVKKLTVEAVHKNYDAGMTNYGGMPDTMPAVTEKEPKAAVKTIADVPDGTYYDGSPNSAKSTVYTVSGDTVTLQKPLPTKVGGAYGSQVGDTPTASWIEQAGTGAVIAHSYAGGSKNIYQGWNKPYLTVSFDENENTFTKQADGTWKDGNGKTVLLNSEVDTNSPNHDPIGAFAKPYSDQYQFTVKSNGVGEPVTLEKKKVNTLFAQGKLVDKYGNSIHADDYTGTITVLGGTAPVATMLAAKKILDEMQPGESPIPKLKELGGLTFLTKSVQDYASSVGVDFDNKDAMWKAIADLIGEQTAGVKVPEPQDTDAHALFKYDPLGHPYPPIDLVGQAPSTIAELNNYIKTASESIGGGKVIGQHLDLMDKDQKVKWVLAFKQGNFKYLYATEVQAGAKEHKAHPNGLLHPGSTQNPDLNKVVWAPAVPGELPSSQTIPGTWTQTTGYSALSAPQEEVSNYLIAAQMQNPTYLTLDERRSWMKWHQSGQQSQVDALSVTALNRKKSGIAPLSPPLAWTYDIKPAKTYDPMFEGADKNPTENWSQQAASDWYADNVGKYPDLQVEYDKAQASPGLWQDSQYKQAAVVAHFQGIKDAEAAKALIPVYKKDPNQSVTASTHPIYNYHDQFGNKFFFKPSPGGDKYRSEAEHLGNQFGKLFGFSTTDSSLVTLDGQYGNLQSDVGGVSDLLNVDFSSLTSQQIADIGMEHLLDHFEDNDDTKGDNAKVLANGRIVGIDKGRAFKHYGSWQGLTADDRMNSNASTIYAKLYNGIRAGKFKKEDLDKAYLQIHKRAEKMSKVSDDRIAEMLADGMQNRKQWDIKYKIDGKPVPANLKGLTAAVLDRKHRLVDDFDQMWAKVYKDAGLGDLPVPPKTRLADGVPAGFDDEQLHEAVFEVNSHGKSTALGGGSFKDGNATLWMDVDADGTKNMNGQGFLRPDVQKTVMSWLAPRAKNLTQDDGDTKDLSVHDVFGTNFVLAAKTINHHAADLNYNQTTMDEYTGAVGSMQKDLDAWKPNLVSNTKDGSGFKFPSGQVIPMNQVDQYKLMLDYYAGLQPIIDAAYTNHTKIPVEQFVKEFQPVDLATGNATWVNTSGHKITKLANGNYIYNDGSTLTMLDHNGKTGTGDIDWSDPKWKATLDASAGTSGWSAQKEIKPKDTASEVKVTLGKRHDRQGEFDKDGNLQYTSAFIRDSTEDYAADSVRGQEYEITLPTGEKIWYANGTTTSTKTSTRGRLQFRLPKVKDTSDSQASMTRVMNVLQDMGIDTTEADEATAERTYWRSMYQVLAYRWHSSGSKYKKVGDALDKKMSELKVHDTDAFLEALSKSMPVEDENAFWRDLWSKLDGADKVNEFIDKQGYLPVFGHLDLKHPEIGTGKPKFQRFDVDPNELENQGKVLSSTVTGAGNTEAERRAARQEVLLKMLKSGGALSTEERLRYYGGYIGGWSSTEDQNRGSAHNVYTRIKTPAAAKASEANLIYSPRSMAFTDSYSYNDDHYGDPKFLTGEAPDDPAYALKSYNYEYNETNIPHSDGLFDGLEVMIFDDPTKRQEAIDFLHAQGVYDIRGLPVEDRIIMRGNLTATLDKIQTMWKAAAKK